MRKRTDSIKQLPDIGQVVSALPPGPLIKFTWDENGKLKTPETHYDGTENKFWARNTHGEFTPFTEQEFRKILEGAFALKKLHERAKT